MGFKLKILILSLLLRLSSLSAQYSIAPIWCFGENAGLDFRTTLIKNFTSNISTAEGSAGATDINGNLIFYTDGATVYDKNFNVMLNGTGLFGSSSSSQSAIVLQHESQKKENQYYIFTLPEYAGSSGFCYSIVDMDNNGGLGEVIIKNKNIYGQLSEQMQPAMHANGKDYWIVIKGFQNTELYSFLIDKDGVQLKQTANFGNSVTNTIGCMRFNNSFSRVAYTCYDFSGYVEICDFDNSTGILSNLLIIDNLHDPYGVCFSPNGQLLYVSHLLTRKINQYDLSQYNKIDILNSAISLTSQSTAFGNINMAYDSILYVAAAGKNFISKISQPNIKGNGCNFVYNGTSLGNSTCNYGLPLFYKFYDKKKLDINILSLCFQDSIDFRCNLDEKTDTFYWLIKGDSVNLKISNKSQFKYKFNSNLLLDIKLVKGLDSITIKREIIDCNKDCNFKIPNVFTPNNDSINDYFEVKLKCSKHYNLSIFDRWGIKVFNSNSPQIMWNGNYNGRNCSDGTYYYILRYTDSYNRRQLINGVIQLIR